jgi:hypothetical protein
MRRTRKRSSHSGSFFEISRAHVTYQASQAENAAIIQYSMIDPSSVVSVVWNGTLVFAQFTFGWQLRDFIPYAF